jgi:sigma-B regulation protein RsbU (phosphoserine phosphatase)
LNFLPRQKPRIKGIDIASLCVPAKEVGGDYYDFIEISPRKLGIVIGDVSGKGISAAFYMTLTKGFLRSQAKSTLSPREVLINMNELFYENAERGMFISMIYGIIDLDAKTLTFARAGHNPMILRRTQEGEAEELNPPGIALGLESGEVFDRTIEERIIGIQKDDAFLFYTDGLNEAQNRALEEFGEDRLIKLVDAYDGLNAEELLNQIQWEIQRFTADAAQHDDMTAVVARIL